MGFVPISRDVFVTFSGTSHAKRMFSSPFLCFGQGRMRIMAVLMEPKWRLNGDKMETEWRENGDKMEMKRRQNGGKKGTTI